MREAEIEMESDGKDRGEKEKERGARREIDTVVPFLRGMRSKIPSGYLKLDSTEPYVYCFVLYIHTCDEV